MWIFAFQYIWASTPYNQSLNTLERSSTLLKTSVQDISDLLDVKDDESIPMLRIESSMIEIRLLLQQLQLQHSSLPLPSPNPTE